VPYLNPEDTLERFSEFALDEIRPAIDDDFLQGQVGSMGSTLRFLSMEIAGKRGAVERQQKKLGESLDNVLEETDNEEISAVVEDGKEKLNDISGQDTHKTEELLLDISNNVLTAIEEELTEESAQTARRPMYEFMDARVEAQLEMLGRERK
jgi:hypothetical protein